MATPIKDTPILSGKDSQRFLKKVKANKSKKVPKKDYKRAIKAYRQMIKNA
jgi:hypothetical protein